MLRYFVIPGIIALVGALVLMQLIDVLTALWAWLISITIVTFFTYGYDKLIAGSARLRVPENTLLALAFVGGTVGALAGMALFHHKTSKRSFQLKLVIVLLVQVTLLVLYIVYTNRT
ncbi:MAG: DUF1294 domain-containing protein [Chloroflexi bacterium]|nr:DUF1294 domain-containing protein [Ardenticatenaceae bacterium]MBL1127797.1 DUF1294 domain-containing protein [Chloroflexota bacterium]NOG33865.1 DUF1294 domain-containing protein [Chloroflexota bacterium]